MQPPRARRTGATGQNKRRHARPRGEAGEGDEEEVSDSPSWEDIRWESAGNLCERLTLEIKREFKMSKPKPRNRAMGFYGDDREIFPAHNAGDVRRLDSCGENKG